MTALLLLRGAKGDYFIRHCESLTSKMSRAKQSQSTWCKMPQKQGYVYLMTNRVNTVIYTGVTGNLKKRIYEHREKLADGFTKKYNIDKLVYYEVFDNIEDAILREKQIKAGSRTKKLNLIKLNNPEFRDLYTEI